LKLPLLHLRRAVHWADWWPSVRGGLMVTLLFVGGIWMTRHYAVPLHDALSAHARLGVLLFLASTVVAVLLPMLSNLPLVPLAVLAWGPGWTALLLLIGWVLGASLSFALGRHGRQMILRRFPWVRRHADVDRLIHPRHRLASLVLLRMTFPVDVLSYALGLFSRQTTWLDNTLSTALGAAPFAVVFALVPTMSGRAQALVFVSSALVFLVYAGWVLHRPDDTLRRDGE
jgi:uncharacterized membrane protein YdjX (TVP38/TMEM64 family)